MSDTTRLGRLVGARTVGVASDYAGMSDDAAPVTVLDRFLAAGISRKHFDERLAAGQVMVAGVRVSDPNTPAPKPVDVGIGLPRDGAIG